MSRTVILTGIRTNNDLHIGNYFGALLPIIDLARTKSDDYQINLFVPDLHSFTTPVDHGTLYDQAIQNVRLFAAAGLPLNAENVYVYRQSFIPAHSELAWILDCFTGVGEMNRMTQFKDKSTKLGNSMVSMGLLNYPVLMASDILLYGASYVPVGDDQKQHIEFARDIAIRMNSRFGDLFVVPKNVKEQHEFFAHDQGLRIKSLVDPTKKMSKSDDNNKGAIFLSDNPEEAAKKIMSATTDSLAQINYDPEKQPGIANLLQLLALISGRPQDAVNGEWQGKTNYGELKQAVSEAVRQFLTDFQDKLSKVESQAILDRLSSSEEAMNKVANETLTKVQLAVGLRK
jgi:tryptophanyl-tRNA synthetase